MPKKDDPNIPTIGEKNKPKEFTFKEEEKNYLAQRQTVIDIKKLELEAMDNQMRFFIVTQVANRLGLDLKKQSISYDLNEGKLYVHDRPAEGEQK